MQQAIGYLRVSTKEQGRSGLGLAEQRLDIENFGVREGFAVKNWYQDIQTGAGKDALLLSPGLAARIQQYQFSQPRDVNASLSTPLLGVECLQLAGCPNHRLPYMDASRFAR
jgi:hypothetical protein